MADDPRRAPSAQLVEWIQQELHASREAEARSQVEIEQMRRTIYELQQRVEMAEKASKTIEPRLQPYTFLPEKLQELERDVEEIRQKLSVTESGMESAVRVLESSAQAERAERGVLGQQLEKVDDDVDSLHTELSQMQQAIGTTNESLHDTMVRIVETEKSLEQVRMLVGQVAETSQDTELRLREEFVHEKEDRFAVVFERLQVVGEMVKRTTDLVEAVAAEQTMREEVITRMNIWRGEHERLESRIAHLEGIHDSIFTQLDRLAQTITLIEGRHTGLADRVGGIRSEFSTIVDQIREEFQKFNQLQATARRRQMEALEQEMRELKFHSLRPPEV